MPRSSTHPIRRAFVVLSATDPIRFGIQQRVQRFLNARAHRLIDISPELFRQPVSRPKARRRYPLPWWPHSKVWLVVVW